MRRLGTSILLSTLVVLFLAPTIASAAIGFSFGGKVLTVLPCSGGMFHVTILPAGRFPAAYIWTPFTVTKMTGIPVPSGQVLGIADIPFVCFLGGGFFSTPIPLPGFRMQYIGTSPPGGAFLLI